MEISLTLFNSIFDNKTTQKLTFKNFDGFEKALYGLAQRKIKSKKDAPLISTAIYKKDSTRCNDGVTAWAGWCAVDVDIEVESEPWKQYKHCLLYTSPSPRDRTRSRMPSSA